VTHASSGPLDPNQPTQWTVVAPETPEGVFAAVEDALNRKFGVDGQVVHVDEDANSATFGMTIAGKGYSLRVNVTS
jgi:F420-0:gamma-glutamyl ligase-like protein